MFHGKHTKVTTQTHDDEDELSREMLVHAFVELSESYDDKKVECSKLEKEIVFLKNQLAIVSKEKDEISSNLVSTQKEFNAYKVACKAKFSKIDEKEISLLKTRIVDFEKVLKDCAFNTEKLEEMFSKKHTSHVKNDKTSHVKNSHAHHAHTSHNTHVKSTHAHNSHAHKSHTHYAFKYGRVYSCTYCGKNGHLAKFCYDQINRTNNLVWVHDTNSLGPKKMWVPKSSPKLFDVGTHQGSKT